MIATSKYLVRLFLGGLTASDYPILGGAEYELSMLPKELIFVKST